MNNPLASANAARWAVARRLAPPAAFAVFVALGPVFEPRSTLGPVALVCGAVGAAALLARGRWVYPAVAAMISGSWLAPTWDGAVTPYVIGLGLALYRLARDQPRARAWLAAATVGVAYLAAMLFGAVSADALGDLVWAAMAVALGDAARSRRLALIASEERAARAERTRELEAQRRVADERLRIARDVHDAIGHRLAVINVHAAVAERLVRSDPERAAAAVGHVRGAGVAVLDELSDLMGALRDPSEADPRDLEISVDRIPELIAEFGAAGMDIRARAEGSRQPLCLAGSQAAYRIVQESLTNASKHARCHPVRVSLSYGAEELTVEVSNALPERDQLTDLGSVQPPQETAHNGIAGMRERALGAGGTLVAGVDGDHFRVIARLPYGQDTSRCPGGEHIDD